MQKQSRPQSQTEEMQASFREAMFAETTTIFDPPDVLLALTETMRIKLKTIQGACHVSMASIAMWASGKRKVPQRHIDTLTRLLRDAILVGHLECNKAERGIVKWGDKPFPAESIAWMRKRIMAAEKVLRDHEPKGH